MPDTQAQRDSYTLYHFEFSICSIMIRYELALCSEHGHSPITIVETPVNILDKEHFTEDFLLNINPRGEVPVLVPPNGKPIPDSVEITNHLAQFYPSLIPSSHEREIKDLLTKLHGISFFSLTFGGHPEGQEHNKRYLTGLLRSGQVDDEYRKAIENRIRIIDEHLDVLQDAESRKNEEYAQNLMREFDELLDSSQTGWLLGLNGPSAIDAHLITFIARMLDRRRDDLIPERLQQYGKKAINGQAWQSVMKHQSTLPLKL